MYGKISTQFLLICLTASGGFLNVQGQYDPNDFGGFQYNLENFRVPEVRYRALDLNSTLFGNLGYNNSEDKHSSFRLNAQINYTEYTNRELYIGIHSSRLRSDFLMGTQENPSTNPVTDDDFFRTLFSLDARSQNYFYLNDRYGGFMGLHGYTAQQLHYYDENRYSSGSEVSGLNFHQTSQAQITYGRGRIEPVRIARTAYDTYALLALQNRLEQSPSDEQIDELAAVMVRALNRRFFDQRFKYIYELEQIDSTLRSQGIITEADMTYFAQVADVWTYANSFARGSGKRWEAGLVGDIAYSGVNAETRTNDILVGETKATTGYRGALLAFAGYTNQKPLNVKWQRDIYLATFAGAGRDLIEGEGFNTEPQLQANASATYEIGWYPNTRTSWRNGAGTGVNYLGESSAGSEAVNAVVHLYSDVYYWISPRFRVYGRVFASYNDLGLYGRFHPGLALNTYRIQNPSQENKKWSVQLQAGFSYAIF